MAQPHRCFDSPRLRPLSVDFDTPTKGSMIFSLLPSVVQSRLPRIPSIRRSASMYGLKTHRKRSESISSSTPTSGTSTPRPEYTNAVVLSSAAEGLEGCSGESVCSEDEASGKLRSSRGLTESESGIDWKFADQGFSLLNHAVEESTSISADRRFGNALFARQLYLHAVTYLLRALPADLTAEEQQGVHSSLPRAVVDNAAYGYSVNHPTPATREPSILHRALACTIVQLFILFQFILPYIRTFLASAYQYDRKHRVSETILSQGLEIVDGIGRTSLSVTGAVYGLNDGKLGQALTEAAAWFVGGVTGGIHDGIGEALTMRAAARSCQERL